MTAVLAALSSALLLAVASVMQHRAGTVTGGSSVWQVFRNRWWLIGAAAGVAGFAMHVLALSAGSLAVVQPLLVTMLLFALPLGLVLDRQALRAGQLLAAAAVVVGLVLFQLSTGDAESGSVDSSALVVCTLALAGVVGAGVFTASRSRRRRAQWLGLCAGISYGLLAALLKASVTELAVDPAAMFTDWPIYAFVVCVGAAIIVNQMAFNAGPLASSLPLMTIADPITAVVVAHIAFGAPVASNPVVLLVEVLGFVIMCIGVVKLAGGAQTHGVSRHAEERTERWCVTQS